MYTSESFEKQLQENLTLYTTAPSSQDIFQVHREISIARFALSQQALSYAKAVELLTNILNSTQDEIKANPSLLTNVMVAIGAIENKSKALIESVQQVTKLIGEVVNIDVDKANLRMMMLNLPRLVESTVLTVTGDENQAQQIANNLNNRISEMMIAFRFAEKDKSSYSQQPQQQEQAHITFDQYNAMLNSVPTSNHQEMQR